MKTVGPIQLKATRPTKWAVLGLLGIGTIEMDEYFFVCWTDEGSLRQEETLQAPAACGYSIRDMTAIPETEDVPKGSWKTTIIGSDYQQIQAVRRHLLDRGWIAED